MYIALCMCAQPQESIKIMKHMTSCIEHLIPCRSTLLHGMRAMIYRACSSSRPPISPVGSLPLLWSCRISSYVSVCIPKSQYPQYSMYLATLHNDSVYNKNICHGLFQIITFTTCFIFLCIYTHKDLVWRDNRWSCDHQ